MMKFWRENVYAAAALLLLRLYVGWQWFDAGLGKLTGGFDAGGFLKGATGKPVAAKTGELVYPTYNWFLEAFAIPNTKLINVLIPWGETLVGLGLILGTLTTAAMFFGLLMNFMFLFAGTVSTNPWMVLLGTLIIVAGANAGRFGFDRYVLPLLHKGIDRVLHRKPKDTATGTGFQV